MTTSSVPLVERVTDAFVELDSDYRFTYLNRGAERLLESDEEELLGRVFFDEFPETAHTDFPDGLYRAMREQVPVSFEVYHNRVETWFEVRVYPSEDALSVFFRDITERRERETMLTQLAAVVESMHAAVVTIDDQNRIVTVNESVEDALDIGREDLVGEHIGAVTDMGQVDADRTTEIGQAIDDVASGVTDLVQLEIGFTDADQEDRIGEVRIIPIDDETAAASAIIRDVTDRHEHERVVEALHELTRWLLQSDDPEDICAIAVHAGSELLDLPISGVWLLDSERGYLDPVASTAGSHDILNGLPRFYQGEGLIWEAFEEGELVRYDDLTDEAGLYTPDTPIRSEIIAPIGSHGVLMTGSTERDAFDETDEELVSTLAENTRAALDRAERQQTLRHRTRQLEHQSERLEAIASVLETDLRRQLDAVEEAAKAEADAWEFPLGEDVVVRTLERTNRLVEDVREFAQIATRMGARTRVTLEEAVDAAIDRGRLDADRVSLTDPASLRADPDRFVHLLQTVFDDHEARASADASLQIEPYGIENGETPGIVIERVGSAATDTEFAETLGLSLVRAIAEAHDWSLIVEESETGWRRIEIADIQTLEP